MANPIPLNPKITDVRNPKYINEAETAIDIEVKYGNEWMPFSCSAASSGFAKQIYDKAKAADFGPVAAYEAPTLPVPQLITRSQCALGMLQMELITGEEALAMTQNGTLPAMVEALINNIPDANDRILAKINFARANYERTNPLLNTLMQAAGYDDDEIDDFFRLAYTL